MITFDRAIPGPTIVVTEGDWVVVTVHNKLPPGREYSSVGVHWHGLDQVLTINSDGVTGVTQCPVPSNSSLVYAFRASTPGTFWYHGHKSEHYLVSNLFSAWGLSSA
jgi:FtsP/CotA-like multicopper oxidase with cupredoxin domain